MNVENRGQPQLSETHLNKEIKDLQEKQRKAYKKLMKATADSPISKSRAMVIMRNIYVKKQHAKRNLAMFLKNDNFPLKQKNEMVFNHA